MDEPNITMEEYIRLEEEKDQRQGRTFNWQTATFGKVENYKDEDDCFINFETEFLSIVFDNTLTSGTTPLCAPTVSPPNKNKIDFRISLDESDDEDYTVIFDENSFSYKIISINDLKTDSENDNDKNNMSSSPKPTVDYLDDLDFFNDFEYEFPAIVYNDGLTSKPDLDIGPSISSKRIDKFETSLSEYDEEEQNVLHFSDSFPPDVFFSNDPKMTEDNMAPLPAADQRHPWLRYQDLAVRLRMVYTEEGRQVFVSHAWRRLFRIRAPLLGGIRRRMTWRLFILALGLHTEQEMAEAGFGAYSDDSDRLIPDKGDLRDYWIEISSNRDFLGPAPSYVLIRDPVRRLCHRMITYNISGRG
ncbi:hypothetical protein Tco_0663275 [Tanacetum coccineum]